MTGGKRFSRPVRIASGPAGRISDVSTVREAAQTLMDVRWPGSRGARHRDAVDACLKVLDGHRSVEDAETAFIEAAKDADILVETPEPKR